MLYTVVERPADHPKGPKVIMKVPYGNPVPAGIIIGKDALITVKDIEEVNDNERTEIQHQKHHQE
jgi:hypothetical protein